MSEAAAHHAVVTRRDGHVFEITLDRPKANAIDSATSIRLGEVFTEFQDDDDLWVAILTGGGERFFSAGWDMKAAVDDDDPEEWGDGGFAGLTELWSLDKPVIAAVRGIAVGGGFELALACDLIVAGDDARFWLSEVNLGFVADAGGIFRLPKRLPRPLAMEMLLTGKELPADEASRWGLVNRVVEPSDVMDAARALAQEVCAAAPLAVRAVKAIVTATEEMTVEEGSALIRGGGVPQYDAALASEDAAEGPRAFAEGRDPEWKGR